MAVADVKQNTEAGSVVTKRVAPCIVESVYTGRMLAQLVGVVRGQLKPFLQESKRLDWIINLEGVTGVELAPSDASAGFYQWFRKSGGDRIALVVRSAMVRMVISALVFAVGTSVQVFERRQQALEYLEKPRTS